MRAVWMLSLMTCRKKSKRPTRISRNNNKVYSVSPLCWNRHRRPLQRGSHPVRPVHTTKGGHRGSTVPSSRCPGVVLAGDVPRSWSFVREVSLPYFLQWLVDRYSNLCLYTYSMHKVKYGYSEHGFKSIINTDSEMSFITLILTVKKVQIVHPWSFATTLFSVFKFFHKCMGKYHRIYVSLLCVEFN